MSLYTGNVTWGAFLFMMIAVINTNFGRTRAHWLIHAHTEEPKTDVCVSTHTHTHTHKLKNSQIVKIWFINEIYDAPNGKMNIPKIWWIGSNCFTVRLIMISNYIFSLVNIIYLNSQIQFKGMCLIYPWVCKDTENTWCGVLLWISVDRRARYSMCDIKSLQSNHRVKWIQTAVSTFSRCGSSSL